MSSGSTANNGNSGSGSGGSGSGSGGNTGPAINAIFWVGVALVVVYISGLAYVLFGEVGADDRTWARVIYILGGIETLAFAATGYIFGREVNRERAVNAEEKADDAQKGSEEAKARAAASEANGKALAQAIQAKAAISAGTTPADGGLERLGGAAGQAAPDVQELAELARRLFP